MNNITDLVKSLKAYLEENEGEFGYWGEAIVSKLQTPKSKIQILQEFHQDNIGDCHRCPLGDTRIKLVFGVGNPEAQVMFIGEGPGYDEDRQGEPFVGKAGQLLDRILAAIGLDRTQVYIANVVKCHPMVDPKKQEQRGNDRPPNAAEIEKCLPFLKEQIRIIAPRIIVTLGSTATQALLQRQEGISKLRGKLIPLIIAQDQAPIDVLPTYHPAALLRDESLKRVVWEDMKLLKRILANAG